MKETELNELERILSNEEELQPMTGFSTRVMRAVREEAAETPPIGFPWKRFLPGAVLNLGLLLVAAVWVLLNADRSRSLTIPVEWFADPQAQGLLWAVAMLLGTGALVWTTFRWAGPRRVGSF